MACMSEGSRFIDITQPFSTDLAVWPGDAPVEIRRAYGVATVSELRLSSHVGTHVDAPAHFYRDGATVDQMPLDALIGSAWVAALPDVGCVTASALDQAGIPADAERLLLATRNSTARHRGRAAGASTFDPAFVALDPSAAGWLRARGIRLLGVDGPSVDPFDSDAFPVHRALLAAGVIIIENLLLLGVAPGSYRLICLPLPYEGGDGAPARVALERI